MNPFIRIAKAVALKFPFIFFVLMLCIAISSLAQDALAQTITGTVTPPLNATIKVTQSGQSTFVPVNQQTGMWTYSLPNSIPYEVTAFNNSNDISDPAARWGDGSNTNNLDFSLLDDFQYKQINGRVTLNGNGVGGVDIVFDKLQDVATSVGGNGNMPLGMYQRIYQVFSPVGIVTVTPSKAGIMTFVPSSRMIQGDQGLAGVNFEVPGPTPPPPPPPGGNGGTGNSTTTHTITGTVTDVNGTPLGGITVWGGPNLGNTTTAANGSYSFSNVSQGMYLGFGPVYSPYYYSPQTAVFPNGITGDIVQDFVGAPLNGPPIFSVEPQDQQVNQYYPVIFQTQVINTPNGVTYEWYKNGNVIPNSNTNILTFNATAADNGALIYCKADNGFGQRFTQVATLLVHKVPEIQVPPVNKTVYSGDPVSFSVVATGEGTLSYWWLTNAFNFPNVNSNTITLTPTLDANGDVVFPGGNQFGSVSGNVVTLYVLVKNHIGNVLSPGATLTVLPQPNAGNGSATGGTPGGNSSSTPSPSPSPSPSPTTSPSNTSPVGPNPITSPSSGGNSGNSTSFDHGIQTLEAVIQEAKAASAKSPLPKGKIALKAYIKNLKLLRKKVSTTKQEVKDAIGRLESVKGNMDAVDYQSANASLQSSLNRLSSTEPGMKRNLRKARNKLNRSRRRHK